MSDAYWRQKQGMAPMPELGPMPWVTPRELRSARVGIVTTAGLRVASEGRDEWRVGDFGFTVIPTGSRDLAMAHASQNFDRTGFLHDIDVVLPITRLEELRERGTIGAVAPRHVSFMGAQVDLTMETIRFDTGPAAARLLRDDGVDVVLLTPV